MQETQFWKLAHSFFRPEVHPFELLARPIKRVWALQVAFSCPTAHRLLFKKRWKNVYYFYSCHPCGFLWCFYVSLLAQVRQHYTNLLQKSISWSWISRFITALSPKAKAVGIACSFQSLNISSFRPHHTRRSTHHTCHLLPLARVCFHISNQQTYNSKSISEFIAVLSQRAKIHRMHFLMISPSCDRRFPIACFLSPACKCMLIINRRAAVLPSPEGLQYK